MDLQEATNIAEELVNFLRPACDRIEIAGSVRRRKPQPKDIEIVYVPAYVPYQLDMFTTVQVPAPDTVIEGLVHVDVLKWDADVRRRGPKYKRLIHRASGTVVELFAAEQDNWGLILALRTGPGDFNRLLVTQRIHGGAMPGAIKMESGWLWKGGVCRCTPDEETFFELIGVPCWPPEERTPDRLQAFLKEPSK